MTRSSSTFPGINHIYEANFGNLAFHLEFQSETEMTYTSMAGQSIGDKQTIQPTIIPIRDGIFTVTWQEQQGNTVVHFEDFEKGVVYAHITTPEGMFLHLKGTLKLLQ